MLWNPGNIIVGPEANKRAQNDELESEGLKYLREKNKKHADAIEGLI